MTSLKHLYKSHSGLMHETAPASIYICRMSVKHVRPHALPAKHWRSPKWQQTLTHSSKSCSCAGFERGHCHNRLLTGSITSSPPTLVVLLPRYMLSMKVHDAWPESLKVVVKCKYSLCRLPNADLVRKLQHQSQYIAFDTLIKSIVFLFVRASCPLLPKNPPTFFT